MIHNFFKGLHVVELASVLAGPAVGMFFAELGAAVVKIENKNTKGDITRSWKLPGEDQNCPISAYWCSVNWKKQSIFADLDDAQDLEQVLNLIAEADIVISNFKSAASNRWGLDSPSLRARFPKLIYAQLNAYADPEDTRPAFDVALQAEAGFLYMTGEPDRPPVKMPVALIDLLAGHQLKEGVLLALLQRERTGAGSLVTVSLLESALASLANQASNYLMTGHIPQPMGAAHPNIAPYGDLFQTADGQLIVVAVGSERQFEQFCLALELEDLPKEPTFATNTDRVRNRPALNTRLAAAIIQFPAHILLDKLSRFGVPAARVRNLASVFELPAAQQMILEEEINGLQTRRMKTVAFNLDSSTY